MTEKIKKNNMAKLDEAAVEMISGGVDNPFAASDEYLRKELGLTDQQFRNMTSAGTYSRGFYVDKLNPDQKAEYERIMDGSMTASK